MSHVFHRIACPRPGPNTECCGLRPKHRRSPSVPRQKHHIAIAAATQSEAQPAKRKKVSLVSLGCPKNIVDGKLFLFQYIILTSSFLEKQLYTSAGEVLLGDLARSGNFEFTDDHEEADAIVVNTCAFVEDAKAESLQVCGNHIESFRFQALEVFGSNVTGNNGGCGAQKGWQSADGSRDGLPGTAILESACRPALIIPAVHKPLHRYQEVLLLQQRAYRRPIW